METSKKTPNAFPRPVNHLGRNGEHYSAQLLEKARADADTVLRELGRKRIRRS